MSTYESSAAPNRVTHAAIVGLRVTLILVFGWLGAMKFTNFEATAIEGLVSSSPFVSWLYGILSVQGASNLIGTVEILIAIGLAAGFVSARVGLVAALAAAATLALTLTFLFTAPGWEASLGGFPTLSVVPGQFLLKDAVLLAAAIYLFGDALERVKQG